MSSRELLPSQLTYGLILELKPSRRVPQNARTGSGKFRSFGQVAEVQLNGHKTIT